MITLRCWKDVWHHPSASWHEYPEHSCIWWRSRPHARTRTPLNILRLVQNQGTKRNHERAPSRIIKNCKKNSWPNQMSQHCWTRILTPQHYWDLKKLKAIVFWIRAIPVAVRFFKAPTPLSLQCLGPHDASVFMGEKPKFCDRGLWVTPNLGSWQKIQRSTKPHWWHISRITFTGLEIIYIQWSSLFMIGRNQNNTFWETVLGNLTCTFSVDKKETCAKGCGEPLHCLIKHTCSGNSQNLARKPPRTWGETSKNEFSMQMC